MTAKYTVQELVDLQIIEKPLDGNHGSIHPTSKDYVEDGIPFIMASDLSNGLVNFSSCKFITEKQANTLRKGFSIAGDILLSHKATIGRTATVQENKYPFLVLTPQVTYYRVKDKQKLNNLYLKYYFDSQYFQSILQQWACSGSTRAYIGITEQLKLPIILPDIDTQNEIVDIIDGLDQKIQLNTQINQTLEQIAQALFKSWFVDFDPVRAKVQALSDGLSLEQAELAAMQAISGKTPEELTALSQTQPERYAELAETAKAFPCEMVEVDGVEVPKGWELSTIGDCYDVVMGQSPKGETYNENKQGMLFYQGRAEFGWRFPTPRLFTTDPKRIAEQNSILMSVRAPVGDINIALEKCCIGRGLAALQHKSKSLSFGLYQIQSIKSELDLFNGEGTVFGSINQANLKNIQIINPDEKFIQLFEKYLSSCDSKIMNNEIENNALKEIRDLLLPRLLNGELNG